MAEPYFNYNDGYDSSLIRASIRDAADASDYARVAEDAERDCINWYAERVASHQYLNVEATLLNGESLTDVDQAIYVFLDGFAKDAAEAEGYHADRSKWTGFARDFRRAIARVVEHRLRFIDDDPTLTSQTRGPRSKTRQAGALDPMWPEHWNRGLERYDLRTGAYHI